MDPWRRWETQAMRESRGRPGPSQHHARAPRPEPRPSPVAEPPPSEAGADSSDPGTMLVPVDAWNRILDQLGNLHEAGQQLAEARERAARAETESQFLRERLAELRAAPSAGSVDESGSASPVDPPAGRGRMQVIRSAYRDLRRPRR